MVRLDKCVEALYDGAAMDDKQKTLHILKVMKGAISMSKSKTGECIFRSNKVENVNLQRLVRGHKKNSMYEVSRIDTHKKMVVSRWSKLLENQTVVSAETLFGEIMDCVNPDVTSSSDRNYLIPSPVRMSQEEDNRLRRLLDLRLSRYDSNPKIVIRKRRRHEFSSRPTTADSESLENQKSTDGDHFVTEKSEIRDKYQNEADPKRSAGNKEKPLLKQNTSLLLPNIVEHQGFKFKTPNSSNDQDDSQSQVVERDVTDWGNWSLKDKTWIKRYITKEQSRQEDLILRNALNNIEKEMSGANTIKRHQIRQKLQLEKEREATERNRMENFVRQYSLPDVTYDSPRDQQSGMLQHSTSLTSLPEVGKDRPNLTQSTESFRMDVKKNKRPFAMSKKNPLSKSLDAINNNANGLPVIVEHPVNRKAMA